MLCWVTKVIDPHSSLMSLWSPCGLYANLPYGYPTASTNFISPTYNGINYNNLPHDDASANLNDLTFDNMPDNYTGISDSSLVNLPYSSVVTSSQTRRPIIKLTTESTDDLAINTISTSSTIDTVDTIDTNLSIKDVIPANSSLSKR